MSLPEEKAVSPAEKTDCAPQKVAGESDLGKRDEEEEEEDGVSNNSSRKSSAESGISLSGGQCCSNHG